ncbi:MAG: nuclear transport factor 2 family protein, partial [Chloroflexi bacterium]
MLGTPRGRVRVLITAGLDIIDRHFAAENAHDIEATLATYTDAIVWDDITHPGSPFRGKQAV